MNHIENEGLKCMGRQHIHFASGKLGDKGVISGMRSSCNVFIYIDTIAAMKGYLSFLLCLLIFNV